MDARELLGRALDVLNRDGWYQGDLFQRPTIDVNDLECLVTDDYWRVVLDAKAHAPVCAVGALYRASSGNALTFKGDDYVAFSEAVVLLERAVNAGLDPMSCDYRCVPEWNDDEYTTFEDVRLVFKKAMEE